MKRMLFMPLLAATVLVTSIACAQDQKPASPPAKVSEKIASGATITINYSQPSVKGRTIGKDLEPLPGKVWRTGANEATVFETDKDITVEGQKLPAGKYGLFTIAGDKEWTIIFNKTWKQWGAFKYSDADDALRVKVPVGKAPAFTETFTIKIGEDGKVSLLWGNTETDFAVK
ncbi:MAG: DUF2911 domain-containing protein [Chitinophagaceae bacterium]|nr:DUF2911 domain-containing protein [Chitinophagaceae bacterium]